MEGSPGNSKLMVSLSIMGMMHIDCLMKEKGISVSIVCVVLIAYFVQRRKIFTK